MVGALADNYKDGGDALSRSKRVTSEGTQNVKQTAGVADYGINIEAAAYK